MTQNFPATALTHTAGPLLIHSLILGARSDYLVAEKLENSILSDSGLTKLKELVSCHSALFFCLGRRSG